MDKRLFGRTGHWSTVAIFGAAAFGPVDQAQADKSMEQVIAAGVNHIDVAPSYGSAEERLGPWMVRERSRFFLGCKTMERSKNGAAEELRRSLKRLKTDRFDLFQIHAITEMEELDQATGPGGALEAIIAARDEGLTRYIGITGHGIHAPEIFIEALARFNFDSVLFPINFVLYANPYYREKSETLLRICKENQVGVMVIKAIAGGPWGDHEKTHNTWYRPVTSPDQIQAAVNFALSQDVTGFCTAGDVHLLPTVLETCENFTRLSSSEQEVMVANITGYEPLFV